MRTIAHRGSHATGFATSGPRRNTVVNKVAEPVDKVLASEWYKKLVEEIDSGTTIVQGHTRYATQNNKHLDEAAHPFIEGHVIGAHNGIINNWWSLSSKINRKDMIVDSQVIFALLNSHNNPLDALKQLEGYFALSWVKDLWVERVEINLLRSDSAQLSAAYVGKWGVLFWHSEKSRLDDLLIKWGIKSDAHIWNLDSEYIYRYDPAEFTIDSSSGVKIKCPLDGTKKQSSQDAWRRWGATTSGKAGGYLPRGTGYDYWDEDGFVSGSTAGFVSAKGGKGKGKGGRLDDLEARVAMLETFVKEFAKTMKKVLPKVQTLEHETEYMMQLLAEAGFMGDDVEDKNEQLALPEVLVCAKCHTNDKRLGDLVQDANDKLVHEACLLTGDSWVD